MDRERDARRREDKKSRDNPRPFSDRKNNNKRKRRGGGSGGFDARRIGPPGDRRRSDGPPQNRRLPARNSFPKINRDKICPLLLRVFPKVGGHHKLDEFGRPGQEPKGDIQIHTWKDATLRELCELIKKINASSARPSARLSFALVYPDKTGRNIMRQIGVLDSTRRGTDDNATLRDVDFQTGDFMSVAIY